MKTRTIAFVMLLALAAWLPTAAQQNGAPSAATPQTQGQAGAAKTADKSACACCEQKKAQGKGETAKSMSCCEGKDMTCCKKDNKDNQTAMNCCAGKDGKQCATKDGKGCCGKDAMACNTKDGKQCCAGHSACSHHNSQS